MLSFEELKELTRQVTWVPGSRFSVAMDRLEGPVLIIEITLPDSTTPDKSIDLRIVTFIPPVETKRHYMNWLLYRLNRIAVHESTEWFKINGERWINPHEPQELQGS